MMFCSIAAQLMRRPFMAGIICTVLALGAVAAVVVPTVCATHGCPPKKLEVRECHRDYPSGSD